MLNTLRGIKLVHNTVRHLSGFFTCSREVAGMYYQMCNAETALTLHSARVSLLQNDIG